MKKTNQSLDQLSKSMERRLRHLMIQTLQKFEDAFPDVDETRSGGIFKTDLRNMFNDVIRAQKGELYDYDIEYRPLKMTDSTTINITHSFMQTVQKVNFGFRGQQPYLQIFSNKDNAKVLDAIRNEFGGGVLYNTTENEMVLEIVGTRICAESVLVLMDRYRLHNRTFSEYLVWRDKVVKVYQEQG